MTPYKMQNLVYEGVDFSEVPQIWAKIGSNLRKLWKNQVILLKIWPKIGWYMNGSLFLEKLVFVWVYFQIPWRHIPTKTKLEYPPGQRTLLLALNLVKMLGVPKCKLMDLKAHNWQKWKRVFLTCPCHEIYRDEAVGLKSCKYTWKITIFVKM